MCLGGFPAVAAAQLPAARPPDKGVANIVRAWPIRGDRPAVYRDEARVSVRVASRHRAVQVSLVKVRSDGTPIRVVSHRTLRRGTVRFTLSSPATYALRLAVGKRRYWSWIRVDICAAPTGDRAELRLNATTIHPGDTLGYRIVNTGSGCIDVGPGYGIERPLPDGSWTAVPTPGGTLLAVMLGPGMSYGKQARIPADLPPGHYRLTDYAAGPVTPEGPNARLNLRLAAEFDVVA